MEVFYRLSGTSPKGTNRDSTLCRSPRVVESGAPRFSFGSCPRKPQEYHPDKIHNLLRGMQICKIYSTGPCEQPGATEHRGADDRLRGADGLDFPGSFI